jgi:hypothetical protein
VPDFPTNLSGCGGSGLETAGPTIIHGTLSGMESLLSKRKMVFIFLSKKLPTLPIFSASKTIIKYRKLTVLIILRIPSPATLTGTQLLFAYRSTFSRCVQKLSLDYRRDDDQQKSSFLPKGE